VDARFNKTRDDRNDPYSQRNATAEEMAFKTAQARKQGGEEAKHAYAETDAGDAADKTTATTNAATDALAANPRAITNEESTRNDLAERQLQATLQQRDIAQTEKLKQDRIGNVSKYNKELGDAILIAGNARKLQNIFDANPNDIPGVGAWDARKPDMMKSQDDIDTQNLFAQFANPQFKDIAGRAVTGSEQERVLGQVGNLKSTNEDVVRSAVKQIADTMGNRIRAGSVGREDIAREVLREHGLDSLLGPETAAPPPAATADDPMAGARPETRVDPNNLGDTGGRRDVPPLPAGAAQAAPMVTVSLPGEPPQQVPRDLAMRMRKLNPQLVIQ
jgi:hypothetical protein